MIHILGTLFAGLLGLAFGSFLNVCVSRWPAGESVVAPGSHCRQCGRTLSWWENVPLVSWIALRGHCRTCGVWIGWRYPIVELAVALIWMVVAWRLSDWVFFPGLYAESIFRGLAAAICHAAFFWLLLGLAALDIEYLWLPDRITLPGIALGIICSAVPLPFGGVFTLFNWGGNLHIRAALAAAISAGIAALLILIIRWLYQLIRKREGVGLGDAKLMAMLAAWLGLEGALLAFGLGIVLGACVALAILIARPKMDGAESWALTKLALGTFLCIGGIISGLWGQQMIHGYLHWAGF
jgi:leader peptidase (prepilin peptidase) / N-methyltransferase